MKDYKLVAFDLDGTLTNPEGGLLSGFAYAIDKMGFDKIPPRLLKKYIGPPLFDAWKTDFSLMDTEAERMVYLFREYYNVYGWWDNKLYPGIREMLEMLKREGKRLAVATSKPQHIAERVLGLFDIARYFEVISGATLDRRRDTKREVLEYALDGFKDVSRDECILVGDRKYDAIGARECGIDSLGVLWGHGSREELMTSGFTLIAESAENVCDCLIRRKY